MTSFFGELRRRNVLRVGIAYVAASWVLLQVADIVLPTFAAPAWIMQVLVFTAALGFPLALVLAWFYDLTPEGLRVTSDLSADDAVKFTARKLDFAIIGALALALVFVVVDQYFIEEDSTSSIDEKIKSVAVLPFVNMSDDPANRYFGDGLSEEILNKLTRVPSLKVIARTSSFTFREEDADVREIG